MQKQISSNSSKQEKNVHDSRIVNVKKSTLPNAGLGLFALHDLKKGSHVAFYHGREIDDKEIHEIKEEERCYILQISRTVFVNAKEMNSCFGRFANTLTRQNKVDFPTLSINAKFMCNNKNNTARIVATKNIPKGSEIFLSYGPRYWIRDSK